MTPWPTSCVRGTAVAIAKSLQIIFVIALTATAPSGPALGQDRMVLGPRQFDKDTGGGAVLCSWSIYLTVQAQTAACGLPRKPTDDAIDQAITAIDEFILANSSLRPTRAMLDDFKRRAAEPILRSGRQGGLQKICQGRDLEQFRSPSPDQIRTSTEALLADPREPVMNPCL